MNRGCNECFSARTTFQTGDAGGNEKGRHFQQNKVPQGFQVLLQAGAATGNWGTQMMLISSSTTLHVHIHCLPLLHRKDDTVLQIFLYCDLIVI